jgi:hypothetical protein
MELQLNANLQNTARAYAAASGLAMTTIGMRSARDARFFDRLADGKGFTVKTYDLVMNWFSRNWPDATPWPEGIPRPDADAAAARTSPAEGAAA